MPLHNLRFDSGSGRFKVILAHQGSRADSEPDALLKDLKVTQNVRYDEKKSLRDKIISIINQSMGNSLINKCFGGAAPIKKDDPSFDYIRVSLKALEKNPRDGGRFVHLILKAAQNADFIDFNELTIIKADAGYIRITIHKGREQEQRKTRKNKEVQPITSASDKNKGEIKKEKSSEEKNKERGQYNL